ncbi:microtubule-associated protein 9 [Megalops cyprinoides]|uniref:microtubule-associated protein 9 n=1 Tax=Megalops cyprinoides TaxID=118141 RepID=UPI0018652B33|nr:microtubule-associated protein 9 [Megalops cyprinoides]XP_036372969.1 microtubule-associated protein 9 [Megalops cyprinoides]XP_036372970.1 microtubule-associated protein 9 [Megalops cyprinoides]
MADDLLGTTLAYTKSPKTSKRTSFQDELQDAVSARARKNKTKEKFSYADDNDDVFEELLNLKKSKAGKKKAMINDFKLSDDEDDKTVKPKKVSFMKTRRKSPPASDGPLDAEKAEEAEVKNTLNSSGSERSQLKSRLSPTVSRSPSESSVHLPTESSEDRQETVTDGQRQETATEGEGQEEVTAVEEGLTGGERKLPVPQPRERSARRSPSPGSVVDGELPKPRPRRRVLKEGSNTEEESVTGRESQRSRPPTSSVSIHLSSADVASITSSTGEREAFRSPSRQSAEEDRSLSSRFSRYPSSPDGQLSESLCRSAEGLEERGFPEEIKQSSIEEPASTSFEEYQETDDPDGETSRQERVIEKSSDSRLSVSATQIARCSSTSAKPHPAESRYLGALKVLDHIKGHMESQPEMADTVRAQVYQEWLRNKNEKLKDAMIVKKKQEKMVEEKKQEELERKEHAKASFVAWNEKKTEVLKAKIKEKQEVVKKQQEEVDEKLKKKETAQQVFEGWKKTQDEYLKERQRKQKLAEHKLQQKKEREAEERKKDCSSSFSKWRETKEEAIQEKLRKARREEKIKEEEEKYMKEEKGKMALEMYEKWLIRKERQERRERKQRRIQAILQDEPPPPWSPPNKTVPFGR